MINKQSNVYTIVYITVMVIVVGAVLAFTSMSLKSRQNENAQADKKSQILQAVHVATSRDSVLATFDRYIAGQLVVDSRGKEIPGAVAFDIDVAAEAKKPADERQLPIYICVLPDGSTKYILPLAGMGLWGPIWGYVAFNDDASTIYGAFFDHQGETPGLGAEITKPAFTGQFERKQVFKPSGFYPITVEKSGQKPSNPDVDYVDGVSGGTITSKGVGAMFDNCLAPYRAWLEKAAAGAVTLPAGITAGRTSSGVIDLNDPAAASGFRQLTADDVQPADANIDIAATVTAVEQARADADAKAEFTMDNEVGAALPANNSALPAKKESKK